MSKLVDSIMDGKALLKYLPAVYQEDEASRELLEGFLSVFGSELQRCEDLISTVPRYIDPTSAPEEFLPWLAGWLALDLYERMGERNREFILKAVELYKLKGTARGLRALAETLTDRRCKIEEAEKKVFKTFSREDIGSDPRNLSRTVDKDKMDLSKMGTFEDEVHYTVDMNPYRLNSRKTVVIFIILEGSEGFSWDDPEYLQHFRRIIESFLPVFIKAEIFIRNDEPFRRSHPTDLIKESWKDEISHYRALNSYGEY